MPIPRHIAYQAGIVSAYNDLLNLVLAFGPSNTHAMVDALAAGERDAVYLTLKKWTQEKYGDQYSMIDEACHTTGKYSLSASVRAIRNVGDVREDDNDTRPRHNAKRNVKTKKSPLRW